MPEPNINLLKIDKNDFHDLFYLILNDLSNIIYNISNEFMTFSIIREIPNLNLDIEIYNYSTTNIYNYFNNFDEFYNYDWIISLIKNNNNCDELKYSMIQIVNLVMQEFLKYVEINYL